MCLWKVGRDDKLVSA